MRKFILVAFLIAVTTGLFAQKLDDAQEKLDKGKLVEAKEKIEKAGQDPKSLTNSDYWFLRAKIYSAMGKEKSDSATEASALAAMQNYFDLEAKKKDETKRLIKSVLENHQTASDIYQSYFAAGIKNFQAAQWNSAFYNFAHTLEAFDLLSKNKITTTSFDTTATLYAGYAAQNARLVDEAAKYYAQIAEHKLADTSYVGVYEFLASYYLQKNDQAMMQKYLTLGKQLFPSNKSWKSLELQSLGNDEPKKLAKLAETANQGPSDVEAWSDYVVELFNYIYAKNTPKDYEQRQVELNGALAKFTANNPQAVVGFYIMTQHTYNQIYDLQQARAAIKGAKPEDTKKKQQLTSLISVQYDKLQFFGTKTAELYDAMPKRKPVENANYSNVLSELAEYYKFKNQPDKAKQVQDKAKGLL